MNTLADTLGRLPRPFEWRGELVIRSSPVKSVRDMAMVSETTRDQHIMWRHCEVISGRVLLHRTQEPRVTPNQNRCDQNVSKPKQVL